MTLSERLNGGRVCATKGCERTAQRDALYCPDCLTKVWITGAEPTPVAAWVRRRDEGLLPAKVFQP